MPECIGGRAVLIESKLLADIGRYLQHHVVHRNAAAIGDTVVLGEIGGDGSSTGYGIRTDPLGKRFTGFVEGAAVGADNRIGKGQKQVTARYSNILGRVDQGVQIYVEVSRASTLTEEPGMAGCSVETLVEC